MHIIELDAEAYFKGDYYTDEELTMVPENWTRDAAPDGMYRGQYQGAQRMTTGEWIGGHWFDVNAPTPEELLENARNDSLFNLNSEFAIALQQVYGNSPAYEAAAIMYQAGEALRWLAAPAENKPATPLLTAYHAARQGVGFEESFEELVERAIERADFERIAIYTAIRDEAARDIRASNDPRSIQWAFSL
jgi:hypothetical protein